ncbi:feather beta keratin-like [Gallus gallus]|uniref:feather beta keratin-like n=1 Tax=Gallus gallus TaxID=9031 RepID=UPI000739E498|nr:feather beta keratin-like [Gallus gallus]|eukprot:XP_004948293.2 feather beta keratin-like [Gallus gallus]
MVYKDSGLRSPQTTALHFSSSLRQVCLSVLKMSFWSQQLSSRCLPPCEVTCPQPYADACSQPCVTSCGDSRAVVYPPPVVITFPGPILSSCPQESIVGSSAPLGLDQPRGLQGSTIYGSSLSSFQQGRSQRYRDCRPC